jgi:S1-C subfamily serine protease
MSEQGTGGAGVLAALSDELAGAAAAGGASVVAIHARRRIPASGVYWGDGVVVASNHTIQREDDVRVTLPDGTSVPAEIAGRDPGTDLAVLRLDGAGTAVARRADASALRVASLVLALGRPWTREVTAALGVVSAVGDEWHTWTGGRIDRLIRLDIAVHDGFSGGPLVDPAGAVLGINTSALARGAPITIPVSTVERVAQRLLSGAGMRPGYLGVAMQPVRIPGPIRQGAGLSQETGLLVVLVEPGSPAERAGILLGDVLVALDGSVVADPSDLQALLSYERVGREVAVRLIRGGQATDVRVTIAERSARRER